MLCTHAISLVLQSHFPSHSTVQQFFLTEFIFVSLRILFLEFSYRLSYLPFDCNVSLFSTFVIVCLHILPISML